SLKGSWESIKDEVWSIIDMGNKILERDIQEVINNHTDLTKIKGHYNMYKEELIDQLKILNNRFQNYYIENFNSIIENSNLTYSETLFKELKSNFEKNIQSAIIFCDGLRGDMVGKLRTELEDELKSISEIKEKNIREIDKYVIVPSITSIGWNAILTNKDTLILTPKYDKGNKIEGIDCKIKKKKNKEGQILNLNEHNDRENRIKEIFNEMGYDLEIVSINDIVNIDEYLNSIYNSSNKNIDVKDKSKVNIKLVVIWYSKIDNHQRTQTEYYSEYKSYINELKRIIKKLHLAQIEKVYLLTDHGFIFANKDNVLKGEIPSGYKTFRFSLTDSVILDKEKKNYSDWLIVTKSNIMKGISKYGLKENDTINNDTTNKDILNKNQKLDLDENLSLIFPKGYGLFQTPKKQNTYIHGGISIEECCIKFLESYCKFNKFVEIDDITAKNHEMGYNTKGEPAFILKTESNGVYYLEIQVKSKKGNNKEVLRPINIVLKSNDKRIDIKPKSKYRLAKNSTKNYKIYFVDNQPPDSFELKVYNEYGYSIFNKSFKITTPSVIPDLF
ncbi:MAG: PglZ domain-containing protein, partial [Promethearchaeota archaeon]